MIDHSRRRALWPWLLAGLVLSVTFPLGFWNNRQQAEEAAPVATPTVSPGELERYIAVYQAMHADHSLTIEDAVRPHGVTVEEFRALERRIQDNPRLVEKVREALLEYARANSAIALVPTPTPTKPAPAKQRRK